MRYEARAGLAVLGLLALTAALAVAGLLVRHGDWRVVFWFFAIAAFSFGVVLVQMALAWLPVVWAYRRGAQLRWWVIGALTIGVFNLLIYWARSLPRPRDGTAARGI